jgi:hypothetical protein
MINWCRKKRAREEDMSYFKRNRGFSQGVLSIEGEEGMHYGPMRGRDSLPKHT